MGKREVSVGVRIDGTAKGFKSAAQDAEKATGRLRKKAKKDSAGIGKSFSTMGLGIQNSFGRLGLAFQALMGIMKAVWKAGVVGVNTFKKALISSGVGALVVLLGTAVGALTSYFQGTKDGADIFNKAMGGIKAVVSTVIKRISLLGEAVTLVLAGQFKEAAAVAKEAITGVGDEIKKNYQLGRTIAGRENKLKDRKNKFITREGELIKEIARLTDISSDKELSIAKRRKGTADAMIVQNVLANERIGIAEEELSILEDKNALGDNTYEDDKLEQEARRKIADIRTDELNKVRELKNRQEEITTAALMEANARERMLATMNKTGGAKKVKVDVTLEDDELDLETGIEQTVLEAEYAIDKLKETQAGYFAYLKQLYNDNVISHSEMVDMKAAKEAADIAESKEAQLMKFNEVLEFTQNSMDTLSDIMESNKQKELSAAGNDANKRLAIERKYARKQKAMAISSALVNGALAITKVLAQTGILSPFAIPAIVAATGLQIAAISAQKFADGGIVSGPTMGMVGEYPGASTNPEVIAPLDKLKGMLADGTGQVIRVEGIISGRDLKIINRRNG